MAGGYYKYNCNESLVRIIENSSVKYEINNIDLIEEPGTILDKNSPPRSIFKYRLIANVLKPESQSRSSIVIMFGSEELISYESNSVEVLKNHLLPYFKAHFDKRF